MKAGAALGRGQLVSAPGQGGALWDLSLNPSDNAASQSLKQPDALCFFAQR